jgi:hypothetical protein
MATATGSQATPESVIALQHTVAGVAFRAAMDDVLEGENGRLTLQL